MSELKPLAERMGWTDEGIVLLSCPCCASDNLNSEADAGMNIHCADCGCGTRFVDDYHEAVELWNRRASPPAIDRDVMEMQSDCVCDYCVYDQKKCGPVKCTGAGSDNRMHDGFCGLRVSVALSDSPQEGWETRPGGFTAAYGHADLSDSTTAEQDTGEGN